MNSIAKVWMIAIALARSGMSASAASAGTLWQANHPDRADVSSRLALQNFRSDERVVTRRITLSTIAC
jgi:hypothetical protein